MDYDIDHAARIILMSAYLYYCRDEIVIEDGENDRLCRFVSDNWDWVDLRYKVLLDPNFQGMQSCRSSTHTAKWTRQVEGGALAWLLERKGKSIPRDYGNKTLGFVEADFVEKRMKIYERKCNGNKT